MRARFHRIGKAGRQNQALESPPNHVAVGRLRARRSRASHARCSARPSRLKSSIRREARAAGAPAGRRSRSQDRRARQASYRRWRRSRDRRVGQARGHPFRCDRMRIIGRIVTDSISERGAPALSAATDTTSRQFGGHSLWEPLKRVMVRQPGLPGSDSDWSDLAYFHPVDIDRSNAEHAAFVELLIESGAEVVIAPPDEPGYLDAVFCYDPSLMTNGGAILLAAQASRNASMKWHFMPGRTRRSGSQFSGRSRRQARSRVVIRSGSTTRRWPSVAATERTARAFGSFREILAPLGVACRCVRSGALSRAGRVPASDVVHQPGGRQARRGLPSA